MLSHGITTNHTATFKCEQLRQAKANASGGPNVLLLLQIAFLLFGILGNFLLLFLFVGRHKLNTASFVYIRIIALWQLVFFVIPYPLALVSQMDAIGDTWLSANFLPAFLGGWNMAMILMILCFAIRLQLIINYLRRSRTWNSYSWIAWRKIFWIIPIATIINVSLCFEFHVDMIICRFADTVMQSGFADTVMQSEEELRFGEARPFKEELRFGEARLSEFAKNDWIKLMLIKMAPTLVFWCLFLILLAFMFNQQQVGRHLSSPITAKHAPLFRNLRPLLLAHVMAQSIAHIPRTVAFVGQEPLPGQLELLLQAISFALPAFLMLALSHSLRSHFRLLINRGMERKKRCPSTVDINGTMRPLSGVPLYSRLETENSEVEDRHFGGKNSSIRAALRADAVHRVRFAMPSPSQLPSVIQEEDEEMEENERDHDSVSVGEKHSLESSVRLKLPVDKDWPSTHDEIV